VEKDQQMGGLGTKWVKKTIEKKKSLSEGGSLKIFSVV